MRLKSVIILLRSSVAVSLAGTKRKRSQTEEKNPREKPQTAAERQAAKRAKQAERKAAKQAQKEAKKERRVNIKLEKDMEEAKIATELGPRSCLRRSRIQQFYTA